MPASSRVRRVRSLAQRLLGRALAASIFWRLRRTRHQVGVALVYHCIGSPGAGGDDRRLSPSLDSRLFARQVDYLRRSCQLVPPSGLQMAIRDRAPGARVPAAITLDDDLSSHVSQALPVLQRANVPAAFFLCGASLTGPHRFWWERLDAALATHRIEDVLAAVEIDAPTIHELGRQLEELPPSRRDELSDRLRELSAPDPSNAGLRASQVQAIADAGFEVGFHTIRHDALTTLDDRQLAAAVSNGRARLELLVGAMESFAYPHGRADSRAIEAVRAAGFGSAFTTTGEAITSEDDPLALSRVEAPLHSVGELAYAVASALRRALRAKRTV